MKYRLMAIFFGVTSSISCPLLANWTLNLGYHNPVNAKLGVNLLYWGSQWNFELGLGWIDANLSAANDKDEQSTQDETTGVTVGGGVNLKYRWGSGALVPYIQAGLGTSAGASVGEKGALGANVGDPFIGLGLMAGKPNFYGYVAYNLSSLEDGQVQAGLGVDI